MSAREFSITIHGLSNADKLDIAERDPQKSVKFATARTKKGRLGEPATIAALLAASALGVIAAWIVKTRRHSLVELDLEVRAKDGSSKRLKFKKEISSETSEAEVLKAIAEVTKLPL